MGEVARVTDLSSPVIEVSPSELVVVGPELLIRVRLHGSRFEIRDARCSHRFVRHLALYSLAGPNIDLITPPSLGSIAPRAARLPEIGDATAVLPPELMSILVLWLRDGRRLVGHTFAELATLARLASVSFAINIGERAADLAVQMTWERSSPLRSSAVNEARDLLAPFEREAAVSERAKLALVAALARVAAND